MSSISTNNNSNNNTGYVKSTLSVDNPKELGIKNYIFVSYEHTEHMGSHILKEKWGTKNKRLFYQINYTFRARLLKKEIFIYQFQQTGLIFGLFHTGLQSKYNKALLFLIFKLSTQDKKQEWTLPEDAKKVGEYLMTKEEVIKKYGIRYCDFPKTPDYFGKRYSFNPHWKLYLDWDADMKVMLNHKTGGNQKQIILTELKRNDIPINTNRMRQELVEPLTIAVNNALESYSKNTDFVCPGIYFLEHGYKIVHQMLLNVEYPMGSGKITNFVAVFDEIKHKKTYKFTKLLNVEMAYKNARLVGRVPQSWTFKEAVKPEKKKKELTPKFTGMNNINNLHKANLKININAATLNSNNLNNLSNEDDESPETKSDTIKKDYFNLSASDLLSLASFSNISNTIPTNYEPPKLRLNDISFTSTLSSVSDMKPPSFSLNNFSSNSNNTQQNLQNINNIQNIQNIQQQNMQQNLQNFQNIQPNIQSNSSSLNLNIFPKTYEMTKLKTLTMLKDGKVIQSYMDSIIETSALNSTPVKNSKVFGCMLNQLDQTTQQQLLIASQVTISSVHKIFQMDATQSIETIEEKRMFKNGTTLSSLKTFFNVMKDNGNIQSTEFFGPNNYLNNSMNIVGNTINTKNSITKIKNNANYKKATL